MIFQIQPHFTGQGAVDIPNASKANDGLLSKTLAAALGSIGLGVQTFASRPVFPDPVANAGTWAIALDTNIIWLAALGGWCPIVALVPQ